MNSLGVLLFQTVGAGYAALNVAGSFDKLEILEFSPLGAQAQLIVKAEANLIEKLISAVPALELLKSVILEKPHEKILKAYLGLEMSPILEEVLVIETDFLGTLFKYANLLLEKNMNIVDLRVFRATNSVCYLTMTGIDLHKHLQPDLNVKMKIIKNLSSGFRSYLDLRTR